MTHSIPLAIVAAFGTGLVTFIGPCAPARIAASRNGLILAMSYVAGTALGFAILGAIGGMLFEAIFRYSPIMYAIIGIIAIVTGIHQLWPTDDGHSHNAKAPDSLFLSALSGFASSYTLAPCCSPIVISALTITTNPADSAAILGAFGIGHALPMLGLQTIVNRFAHRFGSVMTVALAGLSIGLGAYYLVLA
jgi:cytochrome c biogenesis protein CcdA